MCKVRYTADAPEGSHPKDMVKRDTLNSINHQGVRFTKQVQQPLSLILNAGLIYSEIENSGFSVPEQRI